MSETNQRLKAMLQKLDLMFSELDDIKKDIKRLIDKQDKCEPSVKISQERVNHDYGGKNALRITSVNGKGVGNDNVYAYFQHDWDAGRQTATYCKGWTMIDHEGEWCWSMFLDPGHYYIVIGCPWDDGGSVIYGSISVLEDQIQPQDHNKCLEHKDYEEKLA